MYKEESDNKLNEKFTIGNNNITKKFKIIKEKDKKNIPKNPILPKKSKKKLFIPVTIDRDSETKEIFIKPENPRNILIEKNEIPAEKNDDQNKTEEIKNEEDPQIAVCNSKEKRNWKSWSPQEKILFYEIIANGGNYSSLQKLFKTMNNVSKNI